MIDSGITKGNLNSFHLAGVVPVSGQPLDFDLPWHPSLNPVGKDYLALERAVAECAMAGCETIWVVCHKGTQPLLRHRLGDWIKDPASLHSGKSPTDNIREIPIYYVPIHPKDREKRDCLGWSVLYGALTAHWVSRKMSKWVTPDMFYAAFPYGVYPLEFLREHRPSISSRKKFLLKSDGNSVKENLYLGFTFDAEDFKRCRRIVREESTALFDPSGRRYSMEERYSARHFLLDKIFEGVIIDDDTKQINVPWYYDVSTWCGYREYMASDKKLKKPEGMEYNEWHGIARTEDEADI